MVVSGIEFRRLSVADCTELEMFEVEQLALLTGNVSSSFAWVNGVPGVEGCLTLCVNADKSLFTESVEISAKSASGDLSAYKHKK